MADSRTFVLVGNFTDNISPALEKINSSLNSLKRNLGGFSARKGGFDDLTKSMGKVISAHKVLNEEVRTLQSSLRSSISVLKEYRSEMGKAARANYAISKSGSSAAQKEAKFWQDAAASARNYKRELSGIRTPRTPTSYLTPRSSAPTPFAGGGSPPSGRPPRGGFGAAVAGSVAGNQLADLMTNAIVQGFNLGVSIMQKPFEAFASALKERIDDEQSDIKAAGGMFSIARRQKDPFVRTMDEAMEFTQLNNRRLAELAAALPGNTQQYIEVSKRISDSISRIVAGDKEGAIALANEFRRQRGAEELRGTGRAAVQGSITELLGEMTKKTVLAGLGGGGGGPGGVAGAYGLPQLTERMLTQQEVTMGQFQRYAAIFRDPLIMDALERFIPKINETAAGTVDRYKVMSRFFDEVLPPEMIRKFERSTAGIMEAFNTAIGGPETGFFGLGRKMKGLGVVMDDYGRYIRVLEDGTRQVVTNIKDATAADLSVFDMLRDIFANISIVLYPIISNLTMVFDPLKKIGEVLTEARHLTGQFLMSFEQYKKGLQDYVNSLPKERQGEFNKIGVDLRASLAAVNNLFAEFGVISEADFVKTAKTLKQDTFDVGAMMQGMIDKFLSSKIATQIGEFLGRLIGTVLTQVANVTKYVAGTVEAGGLAGGFSKGFKEAGGFQAIQDVFVSIVKLFFKAILTAITEMPLLTAGVAAFALLPMVIGAAISTMVERALGSTTLIDKIRQFIATETLSVSKPQITPSTKPTTFTSAPKSAAFRPLPATRIVSPLAPQVALGEYKGVGGVTSAGKAPSIPGSKISSDLRGMFQPAAAKGFGATMFEVGKGLKSVGPNFLSSFKGITGKLLVFGAVLTSIISLFQGKDLATSLADGAGPMIGAALGGAIGTALVPVLGPLGPMLGSLVGGWIGSLKPVTDFLAGAFTALGEGFMSIMGGLGESFGTIGLYISDLASIFTSLFPQAKGLTEGFSMFRAAIFLVNVALFPITATIDLVNVSLQVLRLAFLATVKTLAQIPGIGKLFGDKEELERRFDEAKERLDRTLKANSERYSWEKFSGKVNADQRAAAAAQKLADSAEKAASNLKPLSAKEAIAQGKASGLKPTASDMAWYQEQLRKARTPSTSSATVTPPTAPTTTAPSVAPSTTAALNRVAASANTLSSSAHRAAASVNTLSDSTAKVGAVNSQLSSTIVSSGTKIVASNNLVSSNSNRLATTLTEGTKKTQASLTQQVATYTRISSSWEKSNVSSQTRLSASASGLAAAINNAASKLRSASAGIGSFSSNPGATGNEGVRAAGKWDGKDRKPVPLQQAIEQEKKHMPSGAHLVIANSSETIIPADKREAVLPANKGLNLDGMAAGFGKFQGALNGLANMAEEFGGMGGAQGNLASAHALAKRFGLILTSYKRSGPASASYHNVGRAMDFSNGTGPTPQMLAYARMMAARYGRSLTELIYTPLGFGIKHGKKVAPYAASSHYNHVHVAYGMGAGNPAFFTSSAAADKWEMAMARREPIVSSVRAKASEVGGSYEITNNFTIVQQPGQDADSLASLVIMKLSMAVDQLRNHTA